MATAPSTTRPPPTRRSCSAHDNDRIATLTLDSPENRNALSSRLVGELAGHLRDIEADDAVRAVVLTHTGNTFCAGADLAEGAREGGPAKGVARLVALLRQIIELDKPVVAKVDGNVRAGGLGLFAACDVTVAGLTSSFALTEARLGLSPRSSRSRCCRA
jgi:enoyl-CoA hydratase